MWTNNKNIYISLSIQRYLQCQKKKNRLESVINFEVQGHTYMGQGVSASDSRFQEAREDKY